MPYQHRNFLALALLKHLLWMANGCQEEEEEATTTAAQQKQWRQRRKRLLRLHIIFTYTYIHAHTNTVACSQCITKTIVRVRTPIGHNYWGKRNFITVSNLRHMLHLLTTWFGLLWPACTFDLCFKAHRSHTHIYTTRGRVSTLHCATVHAFQHAFNK